MSTPPPSDQTGRIARPNWVFRCPECKGERVYSGDAVHVFIYRGWPLCCEGAMTAEGTTSRPVTHAR